MTEPDQNPPDQNPYESPPDDQPAPDSDEKNEWVRSQVDFNGTIWAVGAIGAFLGILVVSLMMGMTSIGAEGALFIVPAIGWGVATLSAGAMLRYPHQATLKTAITFLPLIIPAYILYVPVCGISALMLYGATETVGSDSGTGESVVIIASAFAFSLVLCLVASLMRRYYRHQYKKRMGGEEEGTFEQAVEPRQPTEAGPS